MSETEFEMHKRHHLPRLHQRGRQALRRMPFICNCALGESAFRLGLGRSCEEPTGYLAIDLYLGHCVLRRPVMKECLCRDRGGTAFSFYKTLDFEFSHNSRSLDGMPCPTYIALIQSISISILCLQRLRRWTGRELALSPMLPLTISE